MKKWTVNNIGDEGAAKISESLMTNTTLTELDLQCDDNINESKRNKINNENVNIKRNEKWTGNNIGYEGKKKISESLMTNTTLTKLDLWNLVQLWQTTSFIMKSLSVIMKTLSHTFVRKNNIFQQDIHSSYSELMEKKFTLFFFQFLSV